MGYFMFGAIYERLQSSLQLPKGRLKPLQAILLSGDQAHLERGGVPLIHNCSPHKIFVRSEAEAVGVVHGRLNSWAQNLWRVNS